MTTRAILSALYGLLLLFVYSPQSAGETGYGVMTQDQAFSILRTHLGNPVNVGFVAVHEVEANPDTQQAAQVSLDEARQKHLSLYGGGVLLDLMRTGGFIILEFNEKSGLATRLHSVTLDEAGKPVVQSCDVRGELTKSEVVLLLDRNAAFSDAFLNSLGSGMKQIAKDFGEAKIGSLGALDGKGYFAVPDAVRKLTTRPEDLTDLVALSSTLTLWPARYSLTLSIYAASPVDAIKLARDEQLKLVKEFLTTKGKNADFLYQLLELDSIRTHGELIARLKWLREITSFIDERNLLNLGSPTHKANTLISRIPLDIVAEQDAGYLYGVMTAPGIISIWSRTGTGNFVLKGIGEGEY
jgi:hypothetical protein